jgi:hypothetical protein
MESGEQYREHYNLMGLYQATAAQKADPVAFTNSLAALDAAFHSTFGEGILSGMALATSGAISAGKALAGHILNEPGSSQSALFTGKTGSFDLYATAPVFSSTGGIGAVGSYPAATGMDAVAYIVVTTGASPGSMLAALVATVTVASGTITAVNNAPTGRVNLVTPQAMSATLARLLVLRATYPGALTAGLAVPLTFLVTTPMTITGCLAAVLTAPTGQPINITVKKNGTAMWATLPTIAASATSGGSSGAPDASGGTVAVCAAGDLIEVDLTQVGSGVAGSTLSVALTYTLD